VILDRRTFLRRAALLAAAAVVARAVGQGEPRAVAITDRCPTCGMAVIDARFAAIAATTLGRTLVYDAIECFADHVNGHGRPAQEIASAHLADRIASTREAAVWLPASAALLLHHPRVRTPMGGGLVAFADRASAEAFAHETRLSDPEFLAWSAVLERGRAAPWVPSL
jgi:copper chaperone NosL